jgi:amino acid transporter
MVTAASVIALLAFLLAPIILIRFRKRWVAAFNLACYEPDHEPLR